MKNENFMWKIVKKQNKDHNMASTWFPSRIKPLPYKYKSMWTDVASLIWEKYGCSFASWSYKEPEFIHRMTWYE